MPGSSSRPTGLATTLDPQAVQLRLARRQQNSVEHGSYAEGPSGAVKTIARELSWTYSSAAFEPKAATHIPGVATRCE